MLLVRWGPRTAATAGVRVVWSCRTVQQLPPRIAFEVERGGHGELGLVANAARRGRVQTSGDPRLLGNYFLPKEYSMQQLGPLPAWLADDKEPSMRRRGISDSRSDPGTILLGARRVELEHLVLEDDKAE